MENEEKQTIRMQWRKIRAQNERYDDRTKRMKQRKRSPENMEAASKWHRKKDMKQNGKKEEIEMKESYILVKWRIKLQPPRHWQLCAIKKSAKPSIKQTTHLL